MLMISDQVKGYANFFPFMRLIIKDQVKIYAIFFPFMRLLIKSTTEYLDFGTVFSSYKQNSYHQPK